jgi:hypothetical protein
LANKLVVSSIVTGYRSLQQYNADLAAIVTAFQNTLSRDGTAPNQMGSNLDMNGYQILNAAAASWFPKFNIITGAQAVALGSFYVSTAAGIALALPSASSGQPGQYLKVSDGTGAVSGSHITFTPNGTDTVSGLTYLGVNNGSISLIVNAAKTGWIGVLA